MANVINERDIIGLVRYTFDFYDLKIDKKKFLIETFFSNFGENMPKFNEMIEKSPLNSGILVNTIKIKFNDIIEEEIKLSHNSYSSILSSVDEDSFISPKVYQILIYSIRIIQKLNFLVTPKRIFNENSNISSEEIKILLIYLSIMLSENDIEELNNAIKSYNNSNINISNEIFDMSYKIVTSSIHNFNKSNNLSNIFPILQTISKSMLSNGLRKMSNRLSAVFLSE